MPTTTLIYDTDCGFCRWLLGKLLAWDRRGALRPVALETEEIDRLLAEVPKERQPTRPEARERGAVDPKLLLGIDRAFATATLALNGCLGHPFSSGAHTVGGWGQVATHIREYA